MSTAGDYVGEEVWYRIVQIVTNTVELQEYASRKVYEHLRNPTCHENIVKVAAYILGEFGHLIANEEDEGTVSPIEQFTLINSKISTCSPTTKALILTTYVKWLNLFPEIKPHILVILQKFTHTLDAELQQRACEYLAIASMPDEEILQIVVDEMPPFPESRESALLNRLLKKHSDSGRPSTGKDSSKQTGDLHAARRKAAPTNQNGHADEDQELAAASAAAVQINGVHDQAASDSRPDDDGLLGNLAGSSYVPPDDIMAGLAGLDLSSNPSSVVATPAAGISEASQPIYPSPSSTSLAGPPTPQAEAPLLTKQIPPAARAVPSPSPSASIPTSLPSALPAVSSPTPAPPAEPPQFTHGSDKYLARLSYNSEGILYEDAQLQVGLKSEYHGHLGRISLYFGNKISAAFDSFTVTVESQEPSALSVTLPKFAPTVLNAATQIQQVVQVDCKDLFTKFPVLRISYLAGSLQTITLALPVWLNKFAEPVVLSQVDFFERWKSIGGAPREAQAIFPAKLSVSGGIDVARHKKVVKGLKLGVLDGIDPNANNLVAAAVLHMQSSKVGCLLRLEPNAEAKVRLVLMQSFEIRLILISLRSFAG
jgi:AP-2 complex subunit alpha